MKKQYKLKNRKRFYTIIITLSIMVMIAFFAATAYGYEDHKFNIVKVKKGDTLWAIAGKNCNNGDIRRYIYEIKKVNSMTTSMIYEGDELKIPQ